jgi:hypothetical protein
MARRTLAGAAGAAVVVSTGVVDISKEKQVWFI